MSSRRFDVLHSLHTVAAIGWSDFIVKYRGSALGYFWSLLGPLVRFGVILYVFGPYVQQEIPRYALYLFLGIIIWDHFAVTTSSCMSMLFEKQSIIQRMTFPRILLVLAVGWTTLIVFTTHFFIFLAATWLLGVPITIDIVYIFIIAAQMTLVALGTGMLLASFSLRYRDIPHLWAVVIQLLFWLTPIMYPYRLTEASLTHLAKLITGTTSDSPGFLIDTFIHTQPLSIIIHDARRAFLYGELIGTPSVMHIIGFSLVCGVIFLLGLAVFQRRQHAFPEEY